MMIPLKQGFSAVLGQRATCNGYEVSIFQKDLSFSTRKIMASGCQVQPETTPGCSSWNHRKPVARSDVTRDWSSNMASWEFLEIWSYLVPKKSQSQVPIQTSQSKSPPHEIPIKRTLILVLCGDKVKPRGYLFKKHHTTSVFYPITDSKYSNVPIKII